MLVALLVMTLTLSSSISAWTNGTTEGITETEKSDEDVIMDPTNEPVELDEMTQPKESTTEIPELEKALDEETVEGEKNSDLETLSGTDSNGISWELKDGVMTISGTGPMEDKSSWWVHESDWYNYKDNILTLVIDEGI